MKFREVWAEYTEDVHDKRRELSIPEEFDPEEWGSVGYIPVGRRSDNEGLNWSKFYDFWKWLKENGFVDNDQSKGESAE